MTIPSALLVSFRNAKKQAAKRGIEWHLTLEDLQFLYARSGGACEVSGIPFDFEVWREGVRRPWAASIDRIESDRAYSFKNCRLVCVAANLAMNEWGTSVLYRLSREVYQRRAKAFS